MTLRNKLLLINLLSCFAFPGMTQVADGQPIPPDPIVDTNTTNLVNYLKNFGAFFGVNITTTPSPANAQLIQEANAQAIETALYNTFFGSIPVPMGLGGAVFQFIPTSINFNGAQTINSLANTTFAKYNSVSNTSSNGISVNPLIDQPPYQQDPVSQSILNILGTPDVSYCTNSNGIVDNTCSSLSAVGLPGVMSQNEVISHIIGTVPPGPYDYLKPSYNQDLVSQLSSNSLLAPLYFDTSSNTQSTTGSPSGSSSNTTLTAQNQAQQAANFIRYVSGTVVPTLLPNQTEYNNLFMQATSGAPSAAQSKAQAKLSAYLTILRVYAAQTSVGIGNLYYIFAKRAPQSSGSDSSSASGTSQSTPTSQALNEFNMATWRISNPSAPSGTNQWIDSINNASPATVQKEIAVLLSEINYQLYLDRQIQERLLLTSSVSLLQGTKAGQPNAQLSNQSTSTTDESGSSGN